MYINDNLVRTTGTLSAAVDLIPYIGVQANGAAAARAVGVRGIKISRKYA
jgi:adenine/guanine phosphoribosyltransferase-like PRPP-binding protein